MSGIGCSKRGIRNRVSEMGCPKRTLEKEVRKGCPKTICANEFRHDVTFVGESVCFLGSCLLAVRARSNQESKQIHQQKLQQLGGQMIVYTVQ